MKGCAALVSSKNPDRSASLVTRFEASVNRLTLPAASIDTAASIDSAPGYPSKHTSDNAGAKKASLLVALSGGVDSVVLLSLAADSCARNQCSVRAIYIDHGLQEQSSQWSKFCAAFCSGLDVQFESVQVTVDLKAGLSPEAAARDARYDALRDNLHAGEYLCTAHHADDQAETMLLQMFRGAGVRGLASMPELREFGSGYLLRPLLQCTRAEILSYANDHELRWCEDPSNSDMRYDRNYVRRDLLPSTEQRWPQVISSISRSASHCAEALELLHDLAKLDFADSCVDSSAAGAGVAVQLSVTHLQTLSEVRQKNLLRFWVSQQGFQTPSTTQLHQILHDLVSASEAGLGRINFGGAQIARYQQALFIGERDSFEPLPDFEYHWDDTSTPLVITELNWCLDISARQNLNAYAGQKLLVRNRRGGERWRPDSGHSVLVKSLLQNRRIPPWQRSRLVFVFSDSELVDICGPGFVL